MVWYVFLINTEKEQAKEIHDYLSKYGKCLMQREGDYRRRNNMRYKNRRA